MDPNDVSHVIWALGKHFFFFFFVLFDTNEYFIAFIGIILQITNRERLEASNSHHHHPCQNQDKWGRRGQGKVTTGNGLETCCISSQGMFFAYIYAHIVYQQVIWTMTMRAATASTTSTPAHQSHTIPFRNMTNGGGA